MSTLSKEQLLKCFSLNDFDQRTLQPVNDSHLEGGKVRKVAVRQYYEFVLYIQNQPFVRIRQLFKFYIKDFTFRSDFCLL